MRFNESRALLGRVILLTNKHCGKISADAKISAYYPDFLFQRASTWQIWVGDILIQKILHKIRLLRRLYQNSSSWKDLRRRYFGLEISCQT